MERQIRGTAYVFGDNIDTDQIYPGRYVELTEPGDIALHAMEGADPAFSGSFTAGSIIIAGRNFGCGSSREHAAICLQSIGAAAIVAESFGRIFYRNSINLGLTVLVSPGIRTIFQQGDGIEIDITESRLTNLRTMQVAKIEPLSSYVLEILDQGGIKPMLRKMMTAQAAQGIQAAQDIQAMQST